MKKIFTSFLLVCSLSLFSQTVYYVKTTGSDSHNGLSWATAFKTLQKALAMSSSGEIWVAEGIYYPDDGYVQNVRTYSFHLKNNVAIYGGFAGNEYTVEGRNWKDHPTILSGDIDSAAGSGGNSFHVLIGDHINHSAVLDGFTIRDGNANGGMGNSVGGGLYNIQASPLIRNCIFKNNNSVPSSNVDGGGGVFNYWLSNAVFINCSFIDNACSLFGGAVNNYSSNTSFINCIFTGNSAPYGGALYTEYFNTTNLINCTFYDNRSPNGDAFYSSMGGRINLVNSIVWSHEHWFRMDDYGELPNATYSIIEDGYGGTGCFSQYPEFIDTAGHDFHLSGGSPAIDAGTASFAPLYDIENFPRPALLGYDIGAHEYYSPVVYVRHDAAGLGNNGTSWYNAFFKLQDAIKHVENYPIPVSIHVARGTYYPDEGEGIINDDRSASFMLHNNVKLIGGFTGYDGPEILPRQTTILSGNIERFPDIEANSYHVVKSFNVDSTAVLDGFVIEGGNANSIDNYSGGGILNQGSSARITNCIIRNNHSESGGGGMANLSSSSVKITNTVFYNNFSAYWGGGMLNYNALPEITNCTFYGNTATQGGAIGNINVLPVIRNSIIWGNNSGISTSGGVAFVLNSIVQGGYSGTGNLNTDPMFINPSAGDFHLSSVSPAVNAGNNAFVNFSKDLEGWGRIVGNNVDLGAYECRTAPPLGSVPFILYCPDDFSISTHPEFCEAQVEFSGSRAAIVSGGIGNVQVNYSPASGSWWPIGINTVNISATDDEGNIRTCAVKLTVADSIPPRIIHYGLSSQVLWPPNHKMREVRLGLRRRDNCGEVRDTVIITSNEPVTVPGIDHTSPDWEITGFHQFNLRAERGGSSEGRIYTILLRLTDAAGNIKDSSLTVLVPHDNSAPAAPTADIMDHPVLTDFTVRVMPNPSTNDFTLLCHSPSVEAIYIRVMDNTGRVLDRSTLIKGSGIIKLGVDYLPGIYYAEVVQGANRQTVKLVKR